jgi:CubicO group peptidase (beta-lactamase class C family)
LAIPPIERRERRLVPVLLTALSALAIVSPSLGDRRLAIGVSPMAPHSGTEAVVRAHAAASASGLRPGAMTSLPELVDSSVRRLMAELHAPGSAVGIVHEGQVLFLRGYGVARLDTRVPVDAARTLFRVGSVTKPLTSAAVLQLADDGALDLHRDVREYFPRLSLPYPVTTHQLLTHTAGFDETFAGGFTSAPEHLRPLSQHVDGRATLANQPGLYYSYSNTNYSMAGRLLEQLTGRPYEEAIDMRLFEPLKMLHTTARQPPEAALFGDRSFGYEWEGTGYRALPLRYTQSRPAGAVSTTAADMSRFMLAILGDGSLDGVRVLSPSSRAALLQPQFRDHPRLPGVTYGFHEWPTHGRRLLHHDGTLGDQVAVMLLDPGNRFGLFAASNANPGVGNHLLEPVLTHLYGPAPAPAPRAPLAGAGHASGVAGVYLDLNRTRHDLSAVRALMPMLQSRVAAVDAATIEWGGRRWVEVAPFVFEAPNGDPLVFRHRDGTPIGVMQPWKGTYERIGWREQAAVQLAIAGVCLLVFGASGARLLRTWRRWPEGRAARACALFVALANLAFTLWLVASLRVLGESTPLPPAQVALLALGVSAAAMAALLPALAWRAWRGRWWTRGSRVSYTVLATCAVIFAAWLDAWKLLGFRY